MRNSIEMSANADLQLHTLLLLLADGPEIDQEGMGEFIVVHMYGDIPDYGGARQRLDRRRGGLTATGHTKQPELGTVHRRKKRGRRHEKNRRRKKMGI